MRLPTGIRRCSSSDAAIGFKQGPREDESETPDLALWQKAVLQEITDSGFSGVVLVERDGEPIIREARGYANRSDLVPNRMDTSFGIASGSKVFTAVSVYHLVEQGTLSLDAALGEILDAPLGRIDPRITVRQLLTHTSGIPDYFDEDNEDDYSSVWGEKPVYAMRSPRDFLPLFVSKQMDFRPGDRFKYSNSGFVVLGMVVESVTGRPFHEYVTENVLRRAGMADSGYFSLDRLPERTALGYIDEPGGTWKSNIYSIPVIGGGDGGAFVTAEDMLGFWTALFDHRLLSAEATADLLAPHVKVNDRLGYGYGVWISEGRRFYVVGEDPGVSFSSAVYPKAGVRTVVLGNVGGAAHRVARRIDELIGQ